MSTGQRASRSRPRTHRQGASKRRSRRSVSSLLRDDTAIHRVSGTHPAVRTSMECLPTMMQTVPTTIRAVPPSSARQRASFTAGPIEVMTGVEGVSRSASTLAGSRGQGMALPGAPRMSCDPPWVAMVFYTIEGILCRHAPSRSRDAEIEGSSRRNNVSARVVEGSPQGNEGYRPASNAGEGQDDVTAASIHRWRNLRLSIS